MEIIHKQNKYITNENHIAYLHILKKCMENHINKTYRVSIKLHTDKFKHRRFDDEHTDKKTLEKITRSINYYSTLLTEQKQNE